MTISIKAYAAAMGISQAAAYDRMKKPKYSRFLVVDDHGRKCVNTAIFDLEPAVNLDSSISSIQLENSSADSSVSSDNSSNSSEQLENSSTDSSAQLENLNADSSDSSTDSSNHSSISSAEAAILQLKLEYAQRENERLEQQLDYTRQQVNDMRAQLAAKDIQIADLNARLQEAHVLTLNAQKRPRGLLTGIVERFKGRKTKAAEGAENAAENDNQ